MRNNLKNRQQLKESESIRASSHAQDVNNSALSKLHVDLQDGEQPLASGKSGTTIAQNPEAQQLMSGTMRPDFSCTQQPLALSANP